jgi:hypothetical protein
MIDNSNSEFNKAFAPKFYFFEFFSTSLRFFCPNLIGVVVDTSIPDLSMAFPEGLSLATMVKGPSNGRSGIILSAALKLNLTGNLGETIRFTAKGMGIEPSCFLAKTNRTPLGVFPLKFTIPLIVLLCALRAKHEKTINENN